VCAASKPIHIPVLIESIENDQREENHMKLKKLLAVLTISISVLSVSACAGRTSASNDAPPAKEESTESAASADKEKTAGTAEKDEEASREHTEEKEDDPAENDVSDPY
jgi:hypothetical protein